MFSSQGWFHSTPLRWLFKISCFKLIPAVLLMAVAKFNLRYQNGRLTETGQTRFTAITVNFEKTVTLVHPLVPWRAP